MAIPRLPPLRSRTAAASWVARRLSGRPAAQDERDFHAWLMRGDRNRESYRKAAEALAEFDEAVRVHGARALRPRAASPQARSARRPRAVAALGFATAAAALLLMAGPFIVRLPSLARPAPTTIETGRGELKEVRTADGSVIVLDTLTRVSVELSRGERLMRLERGRAEFRVAKDPGRPFRVVAGRNEVRALGTVFELRREGDDLQVILAEGRLALRRGAVSAMLSAGQAADMTARDRIGVRSADLARDRAWREGRIVLDGDRLADAVAEMNRYNELQLVLEGPSAEDYRVTGVFAAREPVAFSQALVLAFPLRARTEAHRVVLVAAD